MMKAISSDVFYVHESLGQFKEVLKKQKSYDSGHSYEWLSCWWKYYGESGVAKKDLFLLADEYKNGISAIWPLFIRHRYGMNIVHWIGQLDGMTTDYSGPLVDPSNWDKSAQNFIKYLYEQNLRWDVVELRIPNWDNCFPSLVKALSLFGSELTLKWKARIADFSVAIKLPSTFNEYLRSLGKRTRGDIQQYMRRGVKNDFRFVVYEKMEAVKRLPLLFSLNSLNWSIFKNELSKEFFTHTTEQLSLGEENVFLGVLESKEKGVAVVYGFVCGDTCYLHPAGTIRATIAGVSPGITMYAFLIEHMINKGIKKLDLSPGLEEYKLRLGGTVEPIHQLNIWHSKSKIQRWRLFDLGRQIKASGWFS